MSWQEELRSLDEELATGRLSADEYRVRRDNILSSAAGTATPTPVAPPPNPSEQTQAIRPVTLPPPVSADNPDKTQIVNIGDGERTQVVGSDRTQAVGGWQTARPNPGDAERTQVVPGVPGQQQMGGMMPRPAPNPYAQPNPWHQQQDEISPPWAGSEFPPMAAGGSPDWIRQGPEVFDSGSSGGGKKALIIGLVVLVLAGLGAGGYFLFRPKNEAGGQTPTNTSSAEPAPTTTTKPKPTDPNVAAFEELPGPPASTQQLGEVTEVARLVEMKLVDQPEATLITAAGITKVPWKSAVRKAPEDGPTPDAMNTVVIPTKSEADAQKLLADLRAYQESVGLIYIADPLPNMPPTIIFEKKVVAEFAIYRGLYVSGNNVVRITTVQTPLSNEASLSGSYRNQTEAVLKAFPAS
ncbi:hypothetical protein [Alloactinosynnema sp. L-07]|uniref:hypothetical protein n=1 Tax=Alloactinosynnema sp. L-07 TaxID=1653480 RepID=UPI00065F0B40|nr:hypothetical protein [Alloactinosynnema sp. L-07]CRK60785.1 hypothetical protein [Alloactinosynnema sp. L-07]